jgi:hypothetical protein
MLCVLWSLRSPSTNAHLIHCTPPLTHTTQRPHHTLRVRTTCISSVVVACLSTSSCKAGTHYNLECVQLTLAGAILEVDPAQIGAWDLSTVQELLFNPRSKLRELQATLARVAADRGDREVAREAAYDALLRVASVLAERGGVSIAELFPILPQLMRAESRLSGGPEISLTGMPGTQGKPQRHSGGPRAAKGAEGSEASDVEDVPPPVVDIVDESEYVSRSDRIRLVPLSPHQRSTSTKRQRSRQA